MTREQLVLAAAVAGGVVLTLIFRMVAWRVARLRMRRLARYLRRESPKKTRSGSGRAGEVFKAAGRKHPERD